jgi:arginase
MTRTLTVIDAPSNLGLRPPAPGVEPGVKRLPDALRAAGLIEHLGAQDAGRVAAPPYSPDRDPITGVRNSAAIADYSVRLADLVGTAIGAGQWPVVLGGDCSILLGTTLALRRQGRFGLAFVDGHLDFRHGDPNTVGSAAGEDLALVTGRGHSSLTDIEGLGPYVRDEDLVALGFRPSESHDFDIDSTAISLIPAEEVIADPVAAAERALERLGEVDGFWIHVDADVLDAATMPAVDSPEPGGLSFDDLTALLAALVAAPSAVGMEVTILDPDLDPDGHLAASFAAVIEAALR